MTDTFDYSAPFGASEVPNKVHAMFEAAQQQTLAGGHILQYASLSVIHFFADHHALEIAGNMAAGGLSTFSIQDLINSIIAFLAPLFASNPILSAILAIVQGILASLFPPTPTPQPAG